MAELRLLFLEDTLNSKQFAKLKRELVELGVDELPTGEDDSDFEESLTEDQLTDFMDRLDAHDLACNIYLPVEFEGMVEMGDLAVGSAFSLIDALEELREELDIDEEESEEEGDIDVEVIEQQLRVTWRLFLRAASTCVDRQIPLHIISD